ncbi:MAG TPA: hypothetical protein VIM62_00440 [Acidobacteriaceae bacterium]
MRGSSSSWWIVVIDRRDGTLGGFRLAYESGTARADGLFRRDRERGVIFEAGFVGWRGGFLSPATTTNSEEPV